MKAVINPKHILGIDVLRFLAACLVVAFHFCFLMGINPGSLGGSASQKLVAFPELYNYTNFGWVGVQVFFVISGFVIAFSGEKSTAFSFLKSRIVRLGPAVWICAPISLMATMLVGFRTDEIMFRSFRHSMAFVPWEPWIDGSYWTLGIEISFYAAVLFLIRFFKFEYIKLLAVVIGLASSAFWIAKALIAAGGSGEFAAQMKWLSEERNSSLFLIHHGMFFAMGVFLWSELIKKHDVKNLIWIAIFCVTGCVEIAAETDAVNKELSRDCPALIPCMLWLLSIAFIVWSVRANALLHRQSPRVVRMIQTAGAMTYPLYLLHQIVGAALMGWMVSNGINRWTALFAALALLFLATWIIAKHAEPLLQKWTKRTVDFVHERFLAMFGSFAR